MSEIDHQDAVQVGHALQGFGVNLLVSDITRSVAFLEGVFGLKTLNSSNDYALLRLENQYFQLHADHTYSGHPMLSVIPELGARGGGAELRLYDVNPDQAEKRAVEQGYTVLQSTSDKPHGLRECFLLDPDGYCWVPSVKI